MSEDIEHRACFELPTPGGIVETHYGLEHAADAMGYNMAVRYMDMCEACNKGFICGFPCNVCKGTGLKEVSASILPIHKGNIDLENTINLKRRPGETWQECFKRLEVKIDNDYSETNIPKGHYKTAFSKEVDLGDVHAHLQKCYDEDFLKSIRIKALKINHSSDSYKRFLEACKAIDEGDTEKLEKLTTENLNAEIKHSQDLLNILFGNENKTSEGDQAR